MLDMIAYLKRTFSAIGSIIGPLMKPTCPAGAIGEDLMCTSKKGGRKWIEDQMLGHRRSRPCSIIREVNLRAVLDT